VQSRVVCCLLFVWLKFASSLRVCRDSTVGDIDGEEITAREQLELEFETLEQSLFEEMGLAVVS